MAWMREQRMNLIANGKQKWKRLVLEVRDRECKPSFKAIPKGEHWDWVGHDLLSF
jgi:hypothetical protein